MLTWGAFNVVGASSKERERLIEAQDAVTSAVTKELDGLGIEFNSKGNKSKNHLYVLETVCPKTGWRVPMSPTWQISKDWNVVAKLVPDVENKRYNIEIHSGVSQNEMAEAALGTVRSKRLVHPMNPDRSGVEIKTIRGDFRDAEGENSNRLRLWEKSDFKPRPDDIWQERIYAIQWIKAECIGDARPDTYFAAIDDEDLERESLIERIVAENLDDWQKEGLVPDMPIEHGDNTSQPIRERGWTHWHHLFTPRQLLFFAVLRKHQAQLNPSYGNLDLMRLLDRSSKLPKWSNSNGSGGQPTNVFDNQALNTQTNYGAYASTNLLSLIIRPNKFVEIPKIRELSSVEAKLSSVEADVFITDPPYADAINYHEITEFFIAWLRRNPPKPFDNWVWNSRRDKAIKGRGAEFRRDMVAAYTNMTSRMPDNGLQIVMFTHQDAEVWADLGAILWASGLRVTGAWNIVTETEKSSGQGNYVQGTVCLVLRKRSGQSNARRMEIEAEIEGAVAAQLARLNALDDAWHERTNSETLYTDGDLTLAAYAAALQVVTAYSTIDRQPLDRDLYRTLRKNETSMLRELIGYAEQVANGLLVPEGFPPEMWRDLKSPERFYVRMLDMEAKGSAKVADFQNFARSFAFGGYAELLASTTANAAALAGAGDLKGRSLSGEGFWGSQLRQVLFAIWKTMEKRDPKLGVTVLKTEYAAEYWQRRQKLIALASYVAAKTKRGRPEESEAAHELAEALKLDRV
jgi:putative DNA methylase